MPKPASRLVTNAVVRHDAGTGGKLLDKAFAFAFKGLVYAQIWEDPVVDMAALAIRPDSRIVTIASRRLQRAVLSDRQPAGDHRGRSQFAAHLALNKLQDRRGAPSARLRAVPPVLRRGRQSGQCRDLSQACWRHISTRPRSATGKVAISSAGERIKGFSSGIYKRGLLGNFIGLAHFLAKLYRIDPREILEAETRRRPAPRV